MKESTDTPANYTRVEFWAATTLFVFSLFFFITKDVDNDTFSPTKVLFEEAGMPFHFYSDYFFPRLVRDIVLFSTFLLLNFLIVPRLLHKQRVMLNVMMILVLVVVITLVLGTTDTYLKGYLFRSYDSTQQAYNFIFLKAFLFTCRLLFLFAFYTALKYTCLYLLTNATKLREKYRFITTGGLIASVVCIIILFLLVAGDAHREFILIWGIFVPCGILLYSWSFFFLIPRSLNKKKPFLWYLGRTLLVLAIFYLPVSFLILVFTRNDAAFSFGLLNAVSQLFITAPLSWILYKRHLKGDQQVFALQRELGKSNANLDFLRSQINPHFLFNALNTIYGTAIQEKAERTSEGIERLGDMMRFMLQENMQDKISLAREIDYLNNYIGIQRLRTDPNPIVKIEAQIAQPVNTVQIAPMLLIPFVENAFKHGISLRERSYINITLELKGNTLYFDVYNSKHPRPDNDPEKNKSGIGLNNVKQRLKLLYPGKHDLVIRETAKEFFVHLTMQLW